MNSTKTDILILEMAEISINAHTKYVSSKIQTTANRVIYQETIKQIITLLKESDSSDDFLLFLEAFKNVIPEDSWYNFFSSPKHYKELAVMHVQDVVFTLSKRFNKGWAISSVYNA